MKYETQETEAVCTKDLNSYLHKTCMSRYKVNQHLVVLNLHSVSINEILVTKFITVKVSRI